MFANCFQYAPISLFFRLYFSVAGTFTSWDKRASPKNKKKQYIPATTNPVGKISNILPKNICDAFKSYLFERWNASLFIKKFKVCSSYAMKLGLTLPTKNLQQSQLNHSHRYFKQLVQHANFIPCTRKTHALGITNQE